MDEFIIGLFLGILVSALAVTNFDSGFEYRQAQYLASIKVCNTLNSTPKSFDSRDLTCKNGTVVENFVGVAEKLNESN